MNNLLKDERFGFISNKDKDFIIAFNDEMTKLGYDFGDKIGSGYCWGRYMIIYTKSSVKSKKVFARIYIRDESIVLRFFLSDIDSHHKYIENASSHIKEVFTGNYANFRHCHNEKNKVCKFRKNHTIDARLMEKCNGITFEFHNPDIYRMSDYIALFTEFYPNRKVNKIRFTEA